MNPTQDQFPRLLREARAIPTPERALWIAKLPVAEAVRERLRFALQADVTVAGAAPATTDTHVGEEVSLRKPTGPLPDATLATRGATLSDRDATPSTDNTTFQKGQPGGDPMIGRTFAGVVIERVLGSGGMGRVYLGTDGEGGKPVALKVLLRTQRDDSMRKRFEREARLLGELQHPCIAKVLRTGVEEDGDIDIPYIVMEYVEGVLSITDYVFRQRMGTREAAELFVQVCDAVGFAHAKGYMHRDIKPANILVNRQGRVKVIDFGVARAVAIDSAAVTVRTETGQLVGTMQYMSPEQFKADPRLVDKRTDVYALAAVLYELVSGIQPHDLRGLPVHEAARVVCDKDAPDVRECNPRVDAGLAALLAEGLSRDPTKRPDDAIAFGRRLKGWLTTPMPTMVPTIHADHPDKVFQRQAVRDAGGQQVDEPVALRGLTTLNRRPRRTSKGSWTSVSVVTGLMVVAVLVSFDVIPVRQVVGKVREFSGTRQAAADTKEGGAAKAGATKMSAPGLVEQVRVVTAPEGASISVNGEAKGISPALALAKVAPGGSIEIEVSKDGWQTARTRWTQGKDAPLVVLNMVPSTATDRIQRAFVLDTAGLPAGAHLRLTSPVSMAVGAPVEAVVVDFTRENGKWIPVELALEAIDRQGKPLPLQVNARRGLGQVSYDVQPDDARHHLRVRVGDSVPRDVRDGAGTGK